MFKVGQFLTKETTKALYYTLVYRLPLLTLL